MKNTTQKTNNRANKALKPIEYNTLIHLQKSSCTEPPYNQFNISCKSCLKGEFCNFINLRGFKVSHDNNTLIYGPYFPATKKPDLLRTCKSARFKTKPYSRGAASYALKRIRLTLRKALEHQINKLSHRPNNPIQRDHTDGFRNECDGCSINIFVYCYICSSCAIELCIDCYDDLGDSAIGHHSDTVPSDNHSKSEFVLFSKFSEDSISFLVENTSMEIDDDSFNQDGDDKVSNSPDLHFTEQSHSGNSSSNPVKPDASNPVKHGAFNPVFHSATNPINHGVSKSGVLSIYNLLSHDVANPEIIITDPVNDSEFIVKSEECTIANSSPCISRKAVNESLSYISSNYTPHQFIDNKTDIDSSCRDFNSESEFKNLIYYIPQVVTSPSNTDYTSSFTTDNSSPAESVHIANNFSTNSASPFSDGENVNNIHYSNSVILPSITEAIQATLLKNSDFYDYDTESYVSMTEYEQLAPTRSKKTTFGDNTDYVGSKYSEFKQKSTEKTIVLPTSNNSTQNHESSTSFKVSTLYESSSNNDYINKDTILKEESFESHFKLVNNPDLCKYSSSQNAGPPGNIVSSSFDDTKLTFVTSAERVNSILNDTVENVSHISEANIKQENTPLEDMSLYQTSLISHKNQLITNTNVDYISSSNPIIPMNYDTDSTNIPLQQTEPSSTPASSQDDGVLKMLASELSLEIFQKHWQTHRPALITHSIANSEFEWTPKMFKKLCGKDTIQAIDFDGAVYTFKGKDYFSAFSNRRKRQELCKKLGSSEVLKIKDWPETQDLENKIPGLYNDFMRTVPAPEYCSANGYFNLANRLPEEYLPPDLGPKMFISYGSDSTGKNGKTNLHCDITDAVNIMYYADNKTVKAKNKPLAAAVWHIFPHDSLDKLETYIRKYYNCNEKHPIFDHAFFLTTSDLERLENEFGAVPFIIYQNEGDTVFIPAGCAHQVSNYSNSIKCAFDFLSPENVESSLIISKELQKLGKEDALQLRTTLAYAWVSLKTDAC